MSRLHFLGHGSIAPAIQSIPAPAPSDPRTYIVPAWYGSVSYVPPLPPTQSGGAAMVTPATFTNYYNNVMTGNEGVVYCAGGVYAFPNVGGIGMTRNFTNMVLFCPADPANPPIFRNSTNNPANQAFLFNGANNHWFDGWGWEVPNLTLAANATPLLELKSCSNMRFSRGYVQGAADPTYPTVGWGKAFYIRGCDRVSVDGIDFRKAMYGVVVTHSAGGTTRSSNIYIGFNDFRKRTDGSTGVGLDSINLNGVDGCIIEYNLEWNKSWYWSAGHDLHPDFIQFLANDPSSNWAAQYCDHIVIQNNCCLNDNNSRFVDDETANDSGPGAWPSRGLYSQHGFMADGVAATQQPIDGPPFPYNKIVIQNNDYMGTGNHSSFVSSVQYCLIKSNRFKKSNNAGYIDPFSNPLQAWVDVYGNSDANGRLPTSDQITISGNSASQYIYAGTATNVTDDGTNVTDAKKYTDAEFYAVKNPWLTARGAIYSY